MDEDLTTEEKEFLRRNMIKATYPPLILVNEAFSKCKDLEGELRNLYATIRGYDERTIKFFKDLLDLKIEGVEEVFRKHKIVIQDSLTGEYLFK